MRSTSTDTPPATRVAHKPRYSAVALQARIGGLTDGLYQFNPFFKYSHTHWASERIHKEL